PGVHTASVARTPTMASRMRLCITPLSGASEIEQIRQLDRECPLDRQAGQGVTPVVIHHIDVAEWVMGEIEAKVRADLVGVGVVLDKRVEKRARRKPVQKSGTHELGHKLAVWERDVVPAVAQIDIQVIRGPKVCSQRE